MLKIRKIIKPLQHCEDSLIHFCEVSNYKITISSLTKNLNEHPNYPSLLSIMDVLKSFGINCIAAKIDVEELAEIAPPYIVHYKPFNLNHGVFIIVKKIERDTIFFYNPATKKNHTLKQIEFKENYLGTILVSESEKEIVETNYREKKLKEQREDFFLLFAFLGIPILAALKIWINFLQHSTESLVINSFLLLSLIGTIITSLLLWNEVDKYNPTVRQICQMSKKINCNAVLNSKGSKIFGISWSVIGATYFWGILLFLLITTAHTNLLFSLLSVLSTVVLPFTIYSFYYQAFIVKQWCLLCILVQIVLISQSIILYFGSYYNELTLNLFGSFEYFGILTVLFFVFLLFYFLIPTLKKSKDDLSKTISLQRLRHNAQIFESLIMNEKMIDNQNKKLGILIGKPFAKYQIIKVCNPYCPPCARAHPIIDDLLENNEEIQVQIIFTASGKEDDFKTKPVKHLLALASLNDEIFTKKILDDWYLSNKKDYDFFAQSHFVTPQKIDEQTESVFAMKKWCDENQITATPTFFINGRRLPEMYDVSDLKYFLTK